MKRAQIFLFAILFAIPVFAFALSASFPSPAGFVTDTANVMSIDARNSLESELRAFAQAKGYEIAVLTVPTLDGETIENYAVKVFEKWKIGNEKLDTGVLFIVAINDRQMRIEVGYGAEPVLTDVLSSQILNNIVAPLFKEGKYQEGIISGVRNIEKVLSGEPASVSQKNYNSNTDYNFIFFLVFVVLQIIVSIMARTKSWWFGGVAGGVISIILISIFASAIIFLLKITIIVVSIILGLFIDYMVSKHGGNPRGPNIWFLGGGGGGRGGGFGGFGGGMSGGGGASGRW